MELVHVYCFPRNNLRYADRYLCSVAYSVNELKAFGIKDDAIDFNELYDGKSEFVKLYKMWRDPEYLACFYEKNERFFQTSYWRSVDKERFVTDVMSSTPYIFKRLYEAVDHDTIDTLFCPLSRVDEHKADYDSVMVKSKYGEIAGRFAFRIYAVKIDNGCYVITGGTIKLTQEMHDAPNTEIELKKLNMVYGALNGINDKNSLVEFIFD